MGRTALITGITGQDGSYLAELLLQKGYRVYGLVRRTSSPQYDRIQHLLSDLILIQGDLLDQGSLYAALEASRPDEVYNLASMSHVGTSFAQPVATMEVTGLGCTRMLEAIRQLDIPARFYQASTSEIVGQEDQLCFIPKSPYATAKLYAHWQTINARQAHKMYACSGILYNHESPRRGPDFVTQKIAMGVARIRAGLQDTIRLGNLNAYRDWGYAGDYVQAMWLMLQQEQPKDYVIATGRSHSVAEFCRRAFEAADVPHWEAHVQIDAGLYRPQDVEVLVGDPSVAQSELGWTPHVSFDGLVDMMVESAQRAVFLESRFKK